jgi:hypothetical protein
MNLYHFLKKVGRGRTVADEPWLIRGHEVKSGGFVAKNILLRPLRPDLDGQDVIHSLSAPLVTTSYDLGSNKNSKLSKNRPPRSYEDDFGKRSPRRIQNGKA